MAFEWAEPKLKRNFKNSEVFRLDFLITNPIEETANPILRWFNPFYGFQSQN